MFNKISASLLVLAVFVAPAMASAHVTVKPGSVNVGEFTTFNVSAPNEKAIPVTTIKVDIPKNIKSVKPTVKTGWTVSTEKVGEGEAARVTSITWTGGSIPTGLRDDFTFSAQAPAEATEINWSAYETYEDGTVVSWNQAPDAEETENGGPYSTTKIVNDLALDPAANTSTSSSTSDKLPLVISLVALTIAIGGLLFRKKSV